MCLSEALVHLPGLLVKAVRGIQTQAQQVLNYPHTAKPHSLRKALID